MKDFKEIAREAEEIGFEIAKTKVLSLLSKCNYIDSVVRERLRDEIEEKVRL